MNIRSLMQPHMLRLEPYEAVDPPEALAERAGIPQEQVVKLNGNENPYGCSPRVMEAIQRLDRFHIYPDSEQRAMRRALGEYVGLGPEHIVVGNGSDEIIDLILRLFLAPGGAVIDCTPTFGMYRFSTHICGGRTVSVPRDDAFRLDVDAVLRRASESGARLVFIANPNNPSGNTTPREDVVRLLEAGLLVAVDEAYYEFSGSTVADLVPRYPNLVVLRTLSKWAGLAGLRVGYGLMDPAVTEVMLAMKPPYNINQAAEVALLVSIEDRALLLERVGRMVQERERMHSLLERIEGARPWPSEGNFILCQLPEGAGKRVYEGLAKRGVFVRYFSTPRLRDCIRISVGLPEHTDRLVAALREVVR
ncbi:MAG: histidinol-phosphate transaminase [Chloroflexi bacterium]|nr:histidinol-phosphate transaminase [Chloroflexota bacterium]